jgi:hypothetical protein
MFIIKALISPQIYVIFLKLQNFLFFFIFFIMPYPAEVSIHFHL